MQSLIPASVAVGSQGRAIWLKNAARVAFLAVFIKGASWVTMSWLAFRGFSGF